MLHLLESHFPPKSTTGLIAPMLLPSVPTLEAYRPLYRDERLWLPAMRAICGHHHLDPRTLRLAPPGSNVVFWVEEGLLIKLFAPLWPADAAKETSVLKALDHFDAFDVPHIRAEGQIEGWPYLVLTQVAGQPMDTIWDDLDGTARAQLAASLGRRIAALQAVPIEPFRAILDTWPGSWDTQISACLARQREDAIPAHWLNPIAAFLGSTLPALRAPFHPAVLHADLNPEHLFCQASPTGWEVSGMIDFADAMLGHPFYEWVRPCYTFQFEPDLLGVMFSSAGLSSPTQNSALSQSLLAMIFLHRFFGLAELLNLFPQNTPTDLTSLQACLWGS